MLDLDKFFVIATGSRRLACHSRGLPNSLMARLYTTSPDTSRYVRTNRYDQEQRDYLTSIGIRNNGTSDIFHLADGGQLVGPALNPADSYGEVSERWRRSSPKIIVIDDFLTNEAIDGLRRFCWGSTVWRKVYKGGYLGGDSRIWVCLPPALPNRGRTTPHVPYRVRFALIGAALGIQV